MILAAILSQTLGLWPAPREAALGNSSRPLAPDFTFQFVVTLHPTPATLSEAFLRYKALTRPRRASSTTTTHGAIHSLEVSVASTNESPPQLGTNESYTLAVAASGNATLHAPTVYGALRGLETFSQLVKFDASTATYSVDRVPLLIHDSPRFPHRGFMVDTSRHWQSIAMLKRLLDSLAYAKMNVLHWHAVDDQSFPLEVRSFPQLQSLGAFSAAERYTRHDVADVVQYAQRRGIRVLLEIDTPSHTSCWCRGYPSVCPPRPCKDGVTRTPLDPSKNSTFEMIQTLLAEVVPQFPEQLLHVGQDEVDVGCWSSEQNPTIGAWQNSQGFATPDEAYVYTAARIERGVRALNRTAVQWWPGLCLGVPTGNRTCGKTTHFCPCRGVVSGSDDDEHTNKNNHTRGIDKDTILQLWADGANWNTSVVDVVNAGYRAILSTPWYLEDVHLITPWQDFYTVEPMKGIAEDDAKLKARVLGGEAAMWGEYIDGSQLLNTAWPRTAATAERLWSPRAMNSTAEAGPRLAQFRCLLLERGIPAGTLKFVASPYGKAAAGQPPVGPGSCSDQ